ncbi:hypothetical protein MXAN_1655 [Myxococcus xanthus DK 1622]|uniref:Uncharacterized protein n=1 Tax=Myxococcus xanthus (strain DK1622) TaxID=246197 RepID=Q1DBR6_MYXXD|nr:hypothetical protein MXAN_1655 [Myxococcus xanthus DK 1622]
MNLFTEMMPGVKGGRKRGHPQGLASGARRGIHR